MLLNLPIMLWSNALKFCLLCLNYALKIVSLYLSSYRYSITNITCLWISV